MKLRTVRERRERERERERAGDKKSPNVLILLSGAIDIQI